MHSRNSMLTFAAALVLVVGVTVLQGLWTERWAERRDDDLVAAAGVLERAFPTSFGDWKLDRELETSKAELERAGAVGSVSRVFRNDKTKTAISTFVVCATPYDASGHTPDRCYPGAGFEIAEQEHRETIELADGRVAEAYTGTFAKRGQTLRVFWTYGVPAEREASGGDEAPAMGLEPLSWVAPQIARIFLHDYPAVYKLYVIIDQTQLPGSRATKECSGFIAQLLPAFEAAIAANAAGSAPGAAAATAAESPAG